MVINEKKMEMIKWINEKMNDLEESTRIANVLDELGDEMNKVLTGKLDKFSVPAENLLVMIEDVTKVTVPVYKNKNGERLNVFMVTLSRKDIRMGIALNFLFTSLELKIFKEALPEGTYIEDI